MARFRRSGEPPRRHFSAHYTAHCSSSGTACSGSADGSGAASSATAAPQRDERWCRGTTARSPPGLNASEAKQATSISLKPVPRSTAEGRGINKLTWFFEPSLWFTLELGY